MAGSRASRVDPRPRSGLGDDPARCQDEIAPLPDRRARAAAADGGRRRAARVAGLGLLRRGHGRRQPAGRDSSLVRGRRGRHDAQSPHDQRRQASGRPHRRRRVLRHGRRRPRRVRATAACRSSARNGFTVNSVTVVDGGSQIVFNFSGFDAGEKLVFSVDADEAQFVEPAADDVDANSLVEGAEFQRSIIDRRVLRAGYVDLTLTGTYWDAFDDNFAAAQTATGLDARSAERRLFARRTTSPTARPARWPTRRRFRSPRSPAGSTTTAATTASSITARKQGIGGVTLELLDANGNPHRHHDHHVDQSGDARLLRVPQSAARHVRRPRSAARRLARRQGHGRQPRRHRGRRNGGAWTASSARCSTTATTAWTTTSASCCPARSAARVQAHTDEDCDFDHPEILLAGVRIDLLDANGNVIATTLTDANGEYEFTGLAPGIYQVREHQPTDYYDGDERVGTAGGASSDVAGVYSIITGSTITLRSRRGQLRLLRARRRDALGQRLPRPRQRRQLRSRPGEEGIGGVVLKLLDGDGNDTGLRATTDANGFYKFTNLAAGTYTVVEVQPAGWLDGKDTPGNLGGVADVSPPGDHDQPDHDQLGPDRHRVQLRRIAARLDPRPRACRRATRTAISTTRDILLEGVRIDLLDGDGNVLATTLTDANGEYEFTGLRAGHVPASASISPTGTSTAASGSAPSAACIDVPNDTHSAASTLGSGVNGDPLRLLREAARLDQRPRARRHRRGLRLRRSRDSARRRARSSCATATATCSRRRTTDANGEYRFDGLRAGRLPGPRASADRVLRRRRARRHGRRRSSTASTRFYDIHLAPGMRRHAVRLLRAGRRDALGQRLSRPLERRHLRPRRREEGIGGVV